MTGVDVDHLNSLYSDTSDPWGFEDSSYEQAKFRATRDALSRSHYRAVFELGCGNGQLARHLVSVADSYVGMDAVDKALQAARAAVPQGEFVRGYYPCPLPARDFDLLILSEILYFLDHDGIARMGDDIMSLWPRAEILCVTWLGPSGNALQGHEALAAFTPALKTHDFTLVTRTKGYRIDRGLPEVKS